ncbi:hypothetical protein BM221_010702 [Beauveria bassiana]|uniref:Uncharacterized protein n=1 Tax=Beauveria bassiana TaxID=176275 RepID=A0A2N6N897_BEABA|nr:hypothetical protein BM221_010702 [Beauveria bassiana]
MPSLVSCLMAGLAVASRAAALSYSSSETYASSSFEEYHSQTSSSSTSQLDENGNWVTHRLSLDSRSPLLTFEYGTSQPSRNNWIGVWPKDDAQAPTWGSAAWDYAQESSGSLRITPPSSMKAGEYKAYLLSNDRTILAFLQSFDYSPTSSVAFSVKTHYYINCGGSVNNNVNVMPGNGVCVNTNCGVGSLEIPSAGSCPNGQVRISYWQNADCAGEWYGYGYGSRDTCRGLWSDGWGFKSMWLSCAEPSSDCIQQRTCTADPEPSVGVCRAAAFRLRSRYSAGRTGSAN